MTTVTSIAGETVDLICRRHYGDESGYAEAVYDAKGRRTLQPTGQPDVVFDCDEVLVAVGQENAFPWIERDLGLDFDRWGLPKVDAKLASWSGQPIVIEPPAPTYSRSIVA